MAHPAVEAAVEARLRAGFTECEIFVENVLSTPPDDGAPFIILQFPASTDRRRSIGTKFHEQEGAFRIVLHLPFGTGTDTLRAWGEQIAAIFRGAKFSGVQTVDPQSPFLSDQPEGNYTWAAIVVPFRYFYNG